MIYNIGDLVLVKDFIGDDSNQFGLVIEVNNNIPLFITYKVLFEDCIIEVSEIFLEPINYPLMP